MTLDQFTQQLLAHMGIDSATVSVNENDDATEVHIELDEKESGLLIGRHAETLESFQLLSRIIFQTTDSVKSILVNVNDFRQKRSAYLQDLASKLAQRVLETGRPQILRLPASERRVVHMALTDHPDVVTQSDGVGYQRVLKILPREASN